MSREAQTKGEYREIRILAAMARFEIQTTSERQSSLVNFVDDVLTDVEHEALKRIVLA